MAQQGRQKVESRFLTFPGKSCEFIPQATWMQAPEDDILTPVKGCQFPIRFNPKGKRRITLFHS